MYCTINRFFRENQPRRSKHSSTSNQTMNLSLESSRDKLDSVGSGSPPPLDLVVVRETPPRVMTDASTSRVSQSGSGYAAGLDQRALALPTSSAFRLQPRGKPHMPTPSPARGVAPRGRKRGASCLAATLGSIVPSAPRTNGLINWPLSDEAGLGPSLDAPYASSETFRPGMSFGSPPRDFTSESPSRMENALQLLSIASPRSTPAGSVSAESPMMRGTSPFKIYSSASPGLLRPRAESLGSKSCSTTKSSPKTAPLKVIQHDGTMKMSSSSHHSSFPGRGSSTVVNSLDHLMTEEANPPMTPARAPGSVTPKDGATATTCSSGAMHSTPQSHWGETPRSRRIDSSPFCSPLPKVKLTPRKQMHSSERPAMLSPVDIQFSPSDTSLSIGWPDYLQGSSGGTPRHSTSHPSPAECVPTPSNNNVRGRTLPSLPVPGLFSNRPPLIVGDRNSNSNSDAAQRADSKQVSIRSLLAAPLSPYAIRSMAAAAAAAADGRAAALDCDGSLTDDDEDESFVLADPAALVEERHQPEQQTRPSQRRRMSVEDSVPGGLDANGQSTTSLLGMAFVQGDFTNGFSSSNRLSSRLSLSSRGYSPYLEGKDEQNNFHSIGLDLDPDTTEVPVKEKAGVPIDLHGRDLRTPPVLEMSTLERPCSPPAPPRAVSYKRNDEFPRAGPIFSPALSAHNSNSNPHEGRFVSSSSVCLARADPATVHKTISKMIMAQCGHQQQSPEVSCKM